MTEKTVTVPLKKPITFNGEVIETLTFREALTRDLMNADDYSGAFSKTVAVLSSMAGLQGVELIASLPLSETMRITSEVAELMGEFDLVMPGTTLSPSLQANSPPLST